HDARPSRVTILPDTTLFRSLASIALLGMLVFTIGGSLKDVFEIPGSDTQKATDLIKAEFSSEQGSVLNLVFAALKGQRLDTPERDRKSTRLNSSHEWISYAV